MHREMVGYMRPNYKQLLLDAGLVYNESLTEDSKLVEYWVEGPHYVFTSREIKELEDATATLHTMCVEAGDYMLERPDFLRKMGIPDEAVPLIKWTWEENTPNVYGRFDLRYDGNGPPKLLEYNADTPTSLLEASVVQWQWFGWTRRENRLNDQWNDIERKLQEAWSLNLGKWELRSGRRVKNVHVVYDKGETTGEDLMNAGYMADCIYECIKLANSQDATFDVRLMPTTLIGWQESSGLFLDGSQTEIELCFKLYPWEWLASEELFSRQVLENMKRGYDGTTWIEPIFKMLWSNKALLVALWDLYKDDPEKSQYLLPAFWADDDHGLTDYVRKPLLGREGANITIVRDGQVLDRTSGKYGDEGYIVQQLCELPAYPEVMGGVRHPVIGSWVIDGDPAGMGIRESSGLVTDNGSYFAPHGIRG